MPCCCAKILDLCDVGICKDAILKTGINAAVDGDHVLILDFFGVDIMIVQTQVTGAEITFPIDGLNENYEFEGRIVNPAGDQISFIKNAVDYNCIKFRTRLQYTIFEPEPQPEA